MTKITIAPKYTTTDGKSDHVDHKAAVVHQKLIDRTARVLAVVGKHQIASTDEEAKAIAFTVASLGDELVEALTVPSGRAPRKPKAVPAAA